MQCQYDREKIWIFLGELGNVGIVGRTTDNYIFLSPFYVYFCNPYKK